MDYQDQLDLFGVPPPRRPATRTRGFAPSTVDEVLMIRSVRRLPHLVLDNTRFYLLSLHWLWPRQEVELAVVLRELARRAAFERRACWAHLGGLAG